MEGKLRRGVAILVLCHWQRRRRLTFFSFFAHLTTVGCCCKGTMAGINEIKMSGRKSSREEMIDVDDDNESASAIEPQQAAKRQKRNVVVKKEPSQQLTHAAAVLLEPKQEESVVENGGSCIVPDRAVSSSSSSSVAPTRKGLLKIGDEGGDDDDVMVVEPPAETLYAVAAANGGGCGDDEIQMLGCKNQVRLPHLRQHCTEIPFVPLPNFQYSAATGFISKTYVEDEEYEGNIDVCDLCYCYICDKPAKECLVSFSLRQFDVEIVLPFQQKFPLEIVIIATTALEFDRAVDDISQSLLRH